MEPDIAIIGSMGFLRWNGVIYIRLMSSGGKDEEPSFRYHTRKPGPKPRPSLKDRYDRL